MDCDGSLEAPLARATLDSLEEDEGTGRSFPDRKLRKNCICWADCTGHLFLHLAGGICHGLRLEPPSRVRRALLRRQISGLFGLMSRASTAGGSFWRPVSPSWDSPAKEAFDFL